jgi:hypothetical protein
MPRLSSLTNAGLTGARLSFGPIITSYTLTPAANNINEGSGLTFTVGGSNIVNGTYYWTINNTTTAIADFGANSGSFTITNNSGSFSVTPTADATTEGSEIFTVSIRSVSVSGTVLATSANVTVNDTSLTPATYTLTPAANNVNEGSSLTFTVGGSNIVNGTYYWTVTNSGDFGTASGSFNITSNSGSFSVTPAADTTTEGAETFTASIRSGSISGTILQTSSSVTINDTSLTPAPATAPTSITLAVGTVNPVGGVTNVAIPAAGGTDTTGRVTGWVATTASNIRFTVVNGGSATSTITINGSAYTSGNNYTITAAASLTVIVTTSEASRSTVIRTFTIPVAVVVDPNAVWVAATKGFPTTSIDVFSVTSGQLSSSSSTLYSPLEANSVNNQFAISPQNDFVYVPNGTKNRIEIIPVNPNTGIYTGSGATSTSTSALGNYPTNITISPDGNYAYVVFANSFKIAIYSRNAATGALTGISNLRDGYAYSKITSNGAYLYSVLNNLLMYSRNISTGALTLIAENFDAPVNGSFAKIAISSDNRSLYVADFSQNNFYSYLIDPATGLASLSQTISLTGFGADVRSQEVEVSNDGKHVYVTLYDINQVLGTTVIMYSRSLTAPFTLTQANVYTISGAVGEQISNLILTKQQNLLLAGVSADRAGFPIYSWTRNTTTGTLTRNADVAGFGAGIATNR